MQKNWKNTVLVLLTVCMLAGCSKQAVKPSPDSAETDLASKAIGPVLSLFTKERDPRPSAMLGAFVGMYLEGTEAVATEGALRAVGALGTLTSDESVEVDDTYKLLQELGNVLQVDLQDTLNRSENRPETLNEYLASLQNILERSEQKHTELEEYVDAKRDEQKEQRSAVTAIERQINAALKKADYGTAGGLQPELQREKIKLSEIDTEIDRVRDVTQSLEKLLKIGQKRAEAIEKNREILIAGLKIIALPGNEDLGLIEEEKRRRGF